MPTPFRFAGPSLPLPDRHDYRRLVALVLVASDDGVDVSQLCSHVGAEIRGATVPRGRFHRLRVVAGWAFDPKEPIERHGALVGT